MGMNESETTTTTTTNSVPDQTVVQQTPPETVVQQTPPTTVVEQTPVAHRTYVQNDDPVGNAFAASQMIQTIVWAVVVLVLLAIAIWALHTYAGFP